MPHFIAQKNRHGNDRPHGIHLWQISNRGVSTLPLAVHEIGKTNLMQAMQQDKRLCVEALCLGLFMFGGIGLQQTALLYTNVANAAFLTAFYVPLVPLIAALLLRRRIPLNIWPAVIISLVGSYLLSGTSDLTAQFGDLLILVGAFLGWPYPVDTIGYEPNKYAVSAIAAAITSYSVFCWTFYDTT